MPKLPQAQIGIFGGSGFYDFLSKGREVEIKTPYGKPSDKIFIGEYGDKTIAFLPRHGRRHQIPPHKIPYQANLYAFRMLGIEEVIAPIAAGSLQAQIRPGDFVICDQFINKTSGRQDTFFEGEYTKNKFSQAKVVHISSAEPYCQQLRQVAIKAAKLLSIKAHEKGTVVVISGPRFSSKAESLFFQKQGWEVINMTQYPECILAKELAMCYLGIALITDYDAGLKGQRGVRPVSTKEIIEVFKSNNEKVKKLIFEIIKKIPAQKNCSCQFSLKDAMIS